MVLWLTQGTATLILLIGRFFFGGGCFLHAHAYWMRIGACNLMLCPIHGVQADGVGRFGACEPASGWLPSNYVRAVPVDTPATPMSPTRTNSAKLLKAISGYSWTWA